MLGMRGDDDEHPANNSAIDGLVLSPQIEVEGNLQSKIIVIAISIINT
jgi:hypothetical protein